MTPAPSTFFKDVLQKSGGKQALQIEAVCKAQSAAIAPAIASICNEADVPKLQMHAAPGLLQGILKLRHCLLPAWLALVLLLGGCAGAPKSNYAQYSRLTAAQASDVTLYAVGLVGTPYRWGGNTPQGGFDCSGLIGYVYRSQAKLTAPRTVAQLQFWGAPVTLNELRSGDIVLFGHNSRPTHAGIYVGQNRFVHAPASGGKVRLDFLNSSYWARQRMAFRRP